MSDKQAADQARRASNIEVGDLVLLSTQLSLVEIFPWKVETSLCWTISSYQGS